MHVPTSILATANPGADVSLAGVLDRYADELLRHVPRGPTLSDRIRVHVIAASARGAATAEGVARELAMSVRSLHRGLRSEGTTVRALLAESRYSIAEVAFLLGFAELSSFYRTFKRWTGRTPAEVRAEARAR